MVHKKPNWYLQVLKQIDQHELLQKPEFSIFRKRASYIREQMEDQEFRITVVGEFSAGKSTFLNALIGKDVLPHALRETTASVTYIRNVDEHDPRVNKMVIEFANPERDDVTLDIQSDPSALKNYVTTMSSEFNVVKEIRAVHIYLNFPYTNEPIVFVDTPGLNGMAEGHYELTLSEIQRAHASIFLFHIRGLSETNTRLIKLLHQYQQKFIFVLNFIDELKADEGDTPEKKLGQLESELKNAGVIGNIQAFGLSALKALAAKDTNIKRLYAHDLVDLVAERRLQLLQESNFLPFEEYLWNEVILKEKEMILKDSIERSVCQLVNDLIAELTEFSKLNAAKINHEVQIEIKQRLERLRERSAKNWQTTEDYIGSRENDLTNMFRKKVEQDLTDEREKFEQQIRQLPYNQMDLFKHKVENKEYQKQFSDSFKHLSLSYEEALQSLLDEVYHGAILRIRKFHPTIVVEADNNVRFIFNMEETQFEDLDIENKLQASVTKKEQIRQEFKTHLDEKGKAEQALMIVERESKELIKKEKENIEEKLRKVRNLGSIPDVYRYQEKRTREVPRAKYSLFRLFSSTYTETYYVTVTDDSDQRRWKSNKEKIEYEYTQKINEIRANQKKYEERKHRLSRDKVENAKRIEQANRQLEEFTKEINYYTKLRDEVYEQNRREYFEIQKKELLKRIRTYMEDVVLDEFKAFLEKNIASNITTIKAAAKAYYEDSESKYEQKLLLLLQKTQQDYDVLLEESIKQAIMDFSNLLEEYTAREIVHR